MQGGSVMEIQDVLSKNEESEAKEKIYIKHREILEELRKNSQLKEKKIQETKQSSSQEKNNSEDSYFEMIQRFKAATIVSRITRGEEIGENEKFFLSNKYPELLNEANIITNNIRMVLDKMDKAESKEKAEKIIQQTSKNLLQMPYGKENETLFTHLIKKSKEKK